MKKFGGPAFFINRDDINTDEIIPAKYLTEITKRALQPHLLEDLILDGKAFDTSAPAFQKAQVLVTRSNFGCGSSREHAVWALEVNDINVVIGTSFARIFRQNMFNCGILAIELAENDVNQLLTFSGEITIDIDLENEKIIAKSDDHTEEFTFSLNPFDKELVGAGGWLAYADQKY